MSERLDKAGRVSALKQDCYDVPTVPHKVTLSHVSAKYVSEPGKKERVIRRLYVGRCSLTRKLYSAAVGTEPGYLTSIERQDLKLGAVA